MFIKGKAIGLIAAVLTIMFSSILFMVIFFVSGFFTVEDFKTNFVDRLVENGRSIYQAELLFDQLKDILILSQYLTLAATSIGTIALVLVIFIDTKNAKWIGICFLIASIILLFCFAIVSSILFLISSVKLIKYSKL